MEIVSQNTLVVMAAVVGSLLFMAGLNAIWPAEKRRNHNDLVGWQLTILGITSAVFFGFMLYAVWTTYGEADLKWTASQILFRLEDFLPQTF